ncbi:DUF3334 family protein, partial [Acidovorax sp. NPDC077664]|uniref:DUF3334 family protein n=1 Tax=Acidovorax sp. NPDC077664 TaxID=3390544 RepID=UPI003CFC6806
GLAVSVVLVHVVNPQSFHWTMELQVPVARLLAEARRVTFYTSNNNIFYLELAIDRTEFIKLYDFEAQEAPDPDALMAESQAAPPVPVPPPAGQDDTDALLKSLGM